MIAKATIMASIAAAAGQVAGNDRMPAPSANKGVEAETFRLSAAAADDTQAVATNGETASRVDASERTPPKASDLWRSRFDAETLRMFTEVVHPVTRDPIYRIPPGQISEAAEREGEQMAREERQERDLTVVV